MLYLSLDILHGQLSHINRDGRPLTTSPSTSTLQQTTSPVGLTTLEGLFLIAYLPKKSTSLDDSLVEPCSCRPMSSENPLGFLPPGTMAPERVRSSGGPGCWVLCKPSAFQLLARKPSTATASSSWTLATCEAPASECRDQLYES